MLREIKIADTACYSAAGEIFSDLRAVNFIFGTNGVGKTTVSRIINDPESFASCGVTWYQNRPLACFVYNSDFVSRNFAANLRGIFTLGEAAIETLAEIETLKGKVDEIQEEIDRLNNTLGPKNNSSGKRGEQVALRTQFEVNCWKIKSKYDSQFKDAFVGVRAAQHKFCDRVLSESNINSAELISIDILKSKASELFDKGLERHAPISMVDVAELLETENEPVLVKKVVGKEDVDVAALIRRLGNSDWVRQGLPYLTQGSQCPFCQQTVDSDLAARINDYFDECYSNDIAQISKIKEQYDVLAAAANRRLQEILESGNQHVDFDIFRKAVDRLVARVTLNQRLIDGKVREPSSVVSLESIQDIAETIISNIEAANRSVAQHNLLGSGLITSS